MVYSHEVEMMCPVAQGVNHGAAPIPEEAKWVKAKEIKDNYSGAPAYVTNSVSYDIDNILLCGGLTDSEIEIYKNYFIDALEMIKDDPNIKNFYLATISYDQQEPILKIFGNTKTPSAPVKSFEFILEGDKKVLRIK